MIPIMPGGKWHINPLDISESYEFDESSIGSFGEIADPILEKVSFIMKLFESMLHKSWGMDSVQKTLIDECLRDLYSPFMRDGRLYRAPDESRERLKSTLNLSDSALNYITAAPPGQGLFYSGTNTVPFFSRFPKVNEDGSPNLIYPLLTSNASELMEIREQERREKLKREKEEKRLSYR